MKKSYMILPLLMLSLVSCGGGETSSNSAENSYDSQTSVELVSDSLDSESSIISNEELNSSEISNDIETSNEDSVESLYISSSDNITSISSNDSLINNNEYRDSISWAGTIH